MNPTRTNGRSSRPRRTDSAAVGSSAGSRLGGRSTSPAPARSGGPRRSGGQARRPAAVQGEFALPKTITPALPAVEAFADLDMPAQLLAALTAQGVSVPFPIQGCSAERRSGSAFSTRARK
ncbi:hypothetical protein ABZT51_51795, partial [Streptomyces sp. NPDC005373]